MLVLDRIAMSRFWARKGVLPIGTASVPPDLCRYGTGKRAQCTPMDPLTRCNLARARPPLPNASPFLLACVSASSACVPLLRINYQKRPAKCSPARLGFVRTIARTAAARDSFCHGQPSGL